MIWWLDMKIWYIYTTNLIMWQCYGMLADSWIIPALAAQTHFEGFWHSLPIRWIFHVRHWVSLFKITMITIMMLLMCPIQHWLWPGTLRWATWQATSPRPGWGSRTPRGLPSRSWSSNWSEKCHDSIMIIWYSDHIWWLEGRNMRNIMMLMWWSCVMTLSHLPQHCSLISIWRTTQIGSALEWIHSKGLCHLDVKLDNILVFRWLSWS